MWGFQNRVCPSVCLSVCPHPEKRYHHSFVNISPTLIIDTSMKRSSRVLHHGNPKIWIFFQKSSKFEFWLLTKSWNLLIFVNISPTLVIDTSMERSSRVLHHGNQKIGFFFFKKVRNSNFDFWRRAEITVASHRSFVNISPTLVIDTSMERSSRVLHHGNPEMWNFFKKFEIDEIEFCPYPEFPYAEKRNRPGFVTISPTLVIDTSTERSSRVLQHGNQKIGFFFKKVRNWIRLVF